MTCEQKVASELIGLGFSQNDFQNPDLLLYIQFLCSQGASPNWIAKHILRSQTLKDLINALKIKFPHLSDEDFEKLSDMYMDGATVDAIYDAAKEMAKLTPASSSSSNS